MSVPSRLNSIKDRKYYTIILNTDYFTFIFIEKSVAQMYINIFFSTYKIARILQKIPNYVVGTEAGSFNFLFLIKKVCYASCRYIFNLMFCLDIFEVTMKSI